MTGVHITRHAAERFCERVNARLSPDQAVSEIRTHAPAISKAAAFGCSCVILPGRVRLVLEGRSVVTVLGKAQICRSVPLSAREAW